MRIGLVTLGCDKNVVDNEYLAGLLAERGHDTFPADANGAAPPDAVVIITCGFLDVARENSLEEIRRWTELKRARGGGAPRIGVIGCLAQRMGQALVAQAGGGGVDFLAGVGEFERVVRLLEGHECPGGAFAVAATPRVEIPRLLPRRRLEAAPHAYLKISDGCNHTCAFCSIPLMKGRHCSVPRATLVEEARRLVDQGAREINLVSQDSTLYGTDTEGRATLPDLLEDLCAIPGDFWLRVFYLYPAAVSERLIEVVAAQPKIVKYLDIPLQHLDPGVLRAMRRPDDTRRLRAKIDQMRERIPGLVLRTTFIVGFPGETDRAFRALLRGAAEIAFERMGAFLYSPEPDTPAFGMAGAVEAKTAARRFDRLMRQQAEISARWLRGQVGGVRRILIESPGEAGGEWIGRSYSEAPDVDGFVRVRAGKSGAAAAPGDFVEARVTASDLYDLEAEIV